MKKSGVQLISEERERQIKIEGWNKHHDAQHDKEELAKAAVCYATPERLRVKFKNGKPKMFPWAIHWWKPTSFSSKRYELTRIRELEKAGALIAAEIDRLNNLTN